MEKKKKANEHKKEVEYLSGFPNHYRIMGMIFEDSNGEAVMRLSNGEKGLNAEKELRACLYRFN